MDLSAHGDLTTPHDLHPLKVTEGVNHMIQAVYSSSGPAGHAELVSAVNATFNPLWAKAAHFIPIAQQPTTRVMLVAMGELKQMAESEQCTMWAAVRMTIAGSAFHSGVAHLVSLAPTAPFEPRVCEGLDFVV